MPDSRGVRPWITPAAAPMAADQVKPVFDAETRILGRLFARGGREGFEARIRGPKVAVADEEEADG